MPEDYAVVRELIARSEDACALLEQIQNVLVRMFQADDRYGCGFYNDDEWVEAYRELRTLSGIDKGIV